MSAHYRLYTSVASSCFSAGCVLSFILGGFFNSTHAYTEEPPTVDTPNSGQLPYYNELTVYLLPIYCPYISTSEEGTTSEQWTKCSSRMCPLFGGSTACKGILHTNITAQFNSVIEMSLLLNTSLHVISREATGL